MIVEVVEVELALQGVAPERGDLAVAIEGAAKYAKYHPNHHPLNTQMDCI